MKIIGVMGNSGSGKGEVCKILSECDCFIIDCDKIAHEIIKKGNPAYDEIISFFGEEVLCVNMEIDRSRLGSIVFSDYEKLEVLKKITHKYILQKIDCYINENKSYKYLVLDAPLLIEANLHEKSDEVWLVHCERKINIDRIMNRDKISEEQAIKRLNSQMSFDNQKKYADFLIENNGDLATLTQQVKGRLQCI